MYRFLRILNTVLFISVIGIGLFMIGSPVLPFIIFELQGGRVEETPQTQEHIPSHDDVDVSGTLPRASKRKQFSQSVPHRQQRDLNLTIPAIRLNSQLFSSTTNDDLWQGIWHDQSTGNPVDGDNMVITAHRFLYTGNQNTFYHLTKMEQDDLVEVTWQGEVYLYQVSEIKEVEADQIEIAASTEEHRLTLYTCTPLWTSQRRHVVIAKPLF